MPYFPPMMPNNLANRKEAWVNFIESNFIEQLCVIIQNKKSIDKLTLFQNNIETWKSYLKQNKVGYFQYRQVQNILEIAQKAFINRKARVNDLESQISVSNFSEWHWDAYLKFLGQEKPIEKVVETIVLFVDDSRYLGATSKLFLELQLLGKYELYPSPYANTFLYLDEDFSQSIDRVKEYLISLKIWQQSSIRWFFQRHDGKPLHKVGGSSASGAFAVGLWKLLNSEKELDLKDVAISAEVIENGVFRPVEQMWLKIGEQCYTLAKRGLLRLLVVAQGQGIPEEHRNQNFIILEAKNVFDAIEKIREHQKERIAYIHSTTNKNSKLSILGERFVSIDPEEKHYQMLPIEVTQFFEN